MVANGEDLNVTSMGQDIPAVGVPVPPRDLSRPKRPVWHALPAVYDQCVGNCVPNCMPGRDAPGLMYTVHFSCLNYVAKPGVHVSEHE